jgi:hypothetical protein
VALHETGVWFHALNAQPQHEYICVPVKLQTIVNFVDVIDVGTAIEKLVNRKL